jgi:hypothetical protein
MRTDGIEVALIHSTMRGIILLALAIGGCHSAISDMASMQVYVDDTRRETARYVRSAHAALAIDDLRDELEHHRRAMSPIMGDMDDAMSSMASRCDGLGVSQMRAMHGELEHEMTHHPATMGAFSDLGPAVAEVDRHGWATMSMMDDMDEAMDHMACR